MELGQVDFMLLTIKVEKAKEKREDLLPREKLKNSRGNSYQI